MQTAKTGQRRFRTFILPGFFDDTDATTAKNIVLFSVILPHFAAVSKFNVAVSFWPAAVRSRHRAPPAAENEKRPRDRGHSSQKKVNGVMF
jgi:hypothetical protein